MGDGSWLVWLAGLGLVGGMDNRWTGWARLIDTRVTFGIWGPLVSPFAPRREFTDTYKMLSRIFFVWMEKDREGMKGREWSTVH